jgi:hypothetical protein
MKRGNSRGAKGPCQIHVFIRSEEIRLDSRPPTEETVALNWDQQLALPEKKSGTKLPPKVSELRWKLGQKAKQERDTCNVAVNGPTARRQASRLTPICSASACGSCRRLTVDCLRMPWTERILGKPCAGHLHARFEEGGGGGVTPVPPLLDFPSVPS